MSVLFRQTSWGDIEINAAQRRVLFSQRWHYHWRLYTGLATLARPWTYRERHDFHTLADKQIWGHWSNRIVLNVLGSGPLAVSTRPSVRLHFDIEWELNSAKRHFTVTVYKLPPTGDASTFTSNVDFGARTIELTNIDVASYTAENDAKATNPDFHPIPHEFGHALDRRDEYGQSSPHIGDSKSIMNIGAEIRARHLTHVLTELNAIESDTTFSVHSIK